jgi:hypothetical protein
MTFVWIAVGIAVVGSLAKLVAWPHEHAENSLGFVSQQWLTEHRLSHISDPQR